jgi:hypothetical protein
MKKNIFLIGLILIIFVLNFCDSGLSKYTYEITFINKSNHRIRFDYSYSYPDTSLTEIFATSCNNISPNTTVNCHSDIVWEDAFGHNHVKTLCFFITDRDTVDKYGIDVCRQEYKILKRYDYSLNSLEKKNWTITYP